ncbi:MAG: translation initiation factor [bacterium]
MSGKSNKQRNNLVYSTDPNFKLVEKAETEATTLPPHQQYLKVQLDKKQRKGKSVTLISGFVGSTQDLKTLGRLLKTKCGVGGTVKNGKILMQGDLRDEIIQILSLMGYKVKRAGG